MTVSIDYTDGFVSITAVGGETSLDFDFPIFAKAHLRIIRTRSGVSTTLALNTDYTIADGELSQEAGGTAVLVSPAVAADVYTLLLDVPEERTTDFNQAGDFLADTLNRELDLQTQMIQALRRDADKSARLPDTSTLSTLTLPAPEANKLIGWNSGANGMANYAATDLSGTVVSSFIETLLNDTTATEARTTLNALSGTIKATARPSSIVAAQSWADDNTPSATVWTDNIYDGTDDIARGFIDTTNNVYLPGSIGAGTNTIASAATVDLGSVPETSITISGTTTITSFGTSMKAGQAKIVTFSGALTLTHNGTSLILPTGANITTAAGDQALVHCLSSGNYRVMYFRASGAAVSSAPTRQYLTSGTSATYTTPAGARRIRLTMIGGGGGGGGSSGNGGVGGTTSFASWTAIGGSGGGAIGTWTAGAGGTGGVNGGSGNLLRRLAGTAGGAGNGDPYQSTGGISQFGAAGSGHVAAGNNEGGNSAGANSGSGGAGCRGTGQCAGSGGAGEYVEFEIDAPAASYTYTVGAGGAAGSGTLGGAGGSGLIIVDEFY